MSNNRSMSTKGFSIHWPAFLIAFAIGIMYVYLSSEKPTVVIKYPTPYNAGVVIYKDSADTCFVFDAKKVECPAKGAKAQPIQAT